MSGLVGFGYLTLNIVGIFCTILYIYPLHTSLFLNTYLSPTQHNTNSIHSTLTLSLSLSSTMPSLSEAFKAHPVYLHHKHPDFTSLQEHLPDSYAWTQPDSDHHDAGDYPSNNTTTKNVPVIDLKDPNAPTLIGHACKTWGVFQVVNHGIPMSLFTDIQRACLALFSLPLHQKLKAARSPDGVSGYGRARISSFFPKLMWSECFTILDSPQHLFLQLWPQDHAKYWYVTRLSHNPN